MREGSALSDYDHRDQIAQNMRFYGDMRFKQLTLQLAWLTIAGAGISQYGEKLIVSGIKLKLLLASASMLVAAVLWIMEIRSTLYWVAHREAFPMLWPQPKQIKMKWLNASNAALVLYTVIFGFWYWCALQWNCGLLGKILGGVLIVVLLLFSCVNYWHLWSHKESHKSDIQSEH